MLATDNNLRKKPHHPHYLYSILSFRNFQACNLTNKETFQKCFYRTQKQSPGSRQENNCARAPFLTRMQAEACIFTYWHWRFPGNFENYLSAVFLIEYLRWLFWQYLQGNCLLSVSAKITEQKNQHHCIIFC